MHRRARGQVGRSSIARKPPPRTNPRSDDPPQSPEQLQLRSAHQANPAKVQPPPEPAARLRLHGIERTANSHPRRKAFVLWRTHRSKAKITIGRRGAVEHRAQRCGPQPSFVRYGCRSGTDTPVLRCRPLPSPPPLRRGGGQKQRWNLRRFAWEGGQKQHWDLRRFAGEGGQKQRWTCVALRGRVARSSTGTCVALRGEGGQKQCPELALFGRDGGPEAARGNVRRARAPPLRSGGGVGEGASAER
jgi:hypothetical protein